MYTVKFFDLKNQWYDSMQIQAENENRAKDLARKFLGRGFVRFSVVGCAA